MQQYCRDRVCCFLLPILLALSGLLIQGRQLSVPPPAPVLPIPTARQLEWQSRELAMFVHFTVNTFTDREWGDGNEDPSVFNPAQLDVQQWVDTARAFGFKTIVLTAKHHDGFCLWPTQFTDHSVRKSPWRSGKGDVVKELSQACQKAGIKLGLYLSPWDRHEATYGDEARYNLYYLGQLRELLSNYGPVVEVWFDGAKGKNTRDMDYHFEKYWSLVRQLQPSAVIFSDEGPDIRWIGNEKGSAGESCWSMLDRDKVSVGKADTNYLNAGDPNGPDWVPGETDVSIRKGWFWHPDQRPKSVQELLDIYFSSVGRNSVLLLNVPPDNRGLIPQEDVNRLAELRQVLDGIFDENLAESAMIRASEERGPAFAGSKVLDGDLATYWATEDGRESGWLELDLAEKASFNVLLVQEPITLGQRVKQYRFEALLNGKWMPLSSGTTIGFKKLDRFETVTTRKIRLVIEDARACPLISEIGLYHDPGR